jgi:hypothetical protein
MRQTCADALPFRAAGADGYVCAGASTADCLAREGPPGRTGGSRRAPAEGFHRLEESGATAVEWLASGVAGGPWVEHRSAVVVALRRQLSLGRMAVPPSPQGEQDRLQIAPGVSVYS